MILWYIIENTSLLDKYVWSLDSRLGDKSKICRSLFEILKTNSTVSVTLWALLWDAKTLSKIWYQDKL